MRALSLLLVAVLLVLPACSRTPDQSFPLGMQTVRLRIEAVPISMKRRGTHALIDERGATIALAESAFVNLRSLEQQTVELEGHFERNSDSRSPPVFVVRRIAGKTEQREKVVSVAPFQLTLRIPSSWSADIRTPSAAFTASGSARPILVITRRKRSGASVSSTAAGSERLIVGLRDAVASVDPVQGQWIAAVAPPREAPNADETIFAFALESQVELAAQRANFLAILKTVSFSAASPRSSSSVARRSSVPPVFGASSSNPSTGEGMACGGLAGILCPPGFLCRITDAATDSGVCVRR